FAPAFFSSALWPILPFLTSLAMLGCAGTTSPGGPSVVTVAVQPLRATLFLGQTQQFQATVTGASDTSVTWAVNGVTGGSAPNGSISTTGLYTAPGILPSPAVIAITATSVSHPDAAGSAPVTLTDDIVVGVAPTSATISIGAGQAFTASITASGAPSTAVTW